MKKEITDRERKRVRDKAINHGTKKSVNIHRQLLIISRVALLLKAHPPTHKHAHIHTLIPL